MTSTINIGELARIAKKALDSKDHGQEFMLNDVYNVTRAAYERYPEDGVIRQVAGTIERMYEKSTGAATITQAEITNIYGHFAGLTGNSNFKTVLGHLLLDNSVKNSGPDYSRLNSTAAEDLSLSSPEMNSVTDVFASAFDAGHKIPYNKKIAEDGIKIIAAELRALGVSGHSIEILGGDNKIIVYSTQFDSRKGPVAIAIPTEIVHNRVAFPTKFVDGGGLRDLTAANINEFVDKKAENNQFYSERQFPESKPDLDTHYDLKVPTELSHLSRDFEDSVLEAASSFGLDSIRCGKEMVGRELKTAGFHNAQVKFGSESDDAVVYLASIHTPKGQVEIEVPVEMRVTANNKYSPLIPTYFAYDGIIEDFTPIKLQRFAISLPAPSTSNTVYKSAFAYMTLPELKDEILKAASVNDYVSCEAALSEIEDKYPEEDFKNAIADYHYLLMHKTHAENNTEHRKCSKMIPAGHGSIYARCGHLLLPMHKVVVDENGNCRSLASVESERLNPVQESGASISTSKINFT